MFHALADATRRDILVRSFQGPHSVSALARHHSMSFAAVQKHVVVLEEAGLVRKEARGRERLVTGNIDTMRKAQQLLEELEAVWRGRIDQIDALLAQDHHGGTNP